MSPVMAAFKVRTLSRAPLKLQGPWTLHAVPEPVGDAYKAMAAAPAHALLSCEAAGSTCVSAVHAISNGPTQSPHHTRAVGIGEANRAMEDLLERSQGIRPTYGPH